jgi:hypothetical protein
MRVLFCMLVMLALVGRTYAYNYYYFTGLGSGKSHSWIT